MSCTIGPIEIAQVRLRPIVFTIGAFPVVITPTIAVELSGLGEVNSTVSTAISASATATAGARFENGVLSPIIDFQKTFDFQRPDPQGSIKLAATVSPALKLSFYGRGGPEVVFNAGLELNANPNSDPRWTLDAPVSITAELEIPSLDIDAGPITVFSQRFRLAEADGIGDDDSASLELVSKSTDEFRIAGVNDRGLGRGHSAISADGGRLVFQAGLVEPGGNCIDCRVNVFARDMAGGLTKASIAPDGEPFSTANGQVISPDGGSIAFQGFTATTPPAPAEPSGIYVRRGGATTVVALGNVINPAISDNGSVAYDALDSDGDGPDAAGVFVRTASGTTILVSSQAFQGYPSISANGRYVAFTSQSQVYVRDLSSGTTTLVNEPGGRGAAPEISGDGTHVIFDPSGFGSLLIRDLGASAPEPVSACQRVVGPHGSISHDGRMVACLSRPAGASAIQAVRVDTDTGRSASRARQ